MMFVRALLAVLLIGTSGSVAAPRVEILSEWVLPLRSGFLTNIVSRERTTPVLLGDILYAASLTGEVVAVHREKGYLFWSTQLPAGVEGAFAYGRSKLVVGDIQGNFHA